MKSLLMPGLWLLAAALLLHTGLITPSAALIDFAFYGVLVAGLLMAGRFHSSRIFVALLILFLAERALGYFSPAHAPVVASSRVALATIGLLLPFNFVLLSLHQEKGFTLPSLAPFSLLIFIESVIVAVICRPDPVAAHALHHAIATAPMPFATLLVFAAATIILLVRFLLFRKPVESGLLWALASCFIALHFGGAGRIPTAYFATAALTLAGSIVETSYRLAYYDELTALPSRRAFHEALLRLTPPYSIAMVDIDHFKRCNDTYGHDTGDEVLRMVASRLARVAGGGQAYRVGGEEFAIVFSGKTTKDVLDPLEELRSDIAASSFRLRGGERRQEARGPDRRTLRAQTSTQTRTQTGHAIRKLAQASAHQASAPTELSVTASMGVATATQPNSSAEEVIKAADKALYRAKNAGRNRIETAGAARRRARSKSAGIA
jgi:diguanylate cyclase (GGDEF)-like protein